MTDEDQRTPKVNFGFHGSRNHISSNGKCNMCVFTVCFKLNSLITLHAKYAPCTEMTFQINLQKALHWNPHILLWSFCLCLLASSCSFLFHVWLDNCKYKQDHHFLMLFYVIPTVMLRYGKQWLFFLTGIITVGAIVLCKSLKSLFPLSGNCRYPIHIVCQHRLERL